MREDLLRQFRSPTKLLSFLPKLLQTADIVTRLSLLSILHQVSFSGTGSMTSDSRAALQMTGPQSSSGSCIIHCWKSILLYYLRIPSQRTTGTVGLNSTKNVKLNWLGMIYWLQTQNMYRRQTTKKHAILCCSRSTKLEASQKQLQRKLLLLSTCLCHLFR